MIGKSATQSLKMIQIQHPGLVILKSSMAAYFHCQVQENIHAPQATVIGNPEAEGALKSQFKIFKGKYVACEYSLLPSRASMYLK